MTTLTITPNWKNKTARFKGTIAAGEHVAVSIANDDNFIADTTNLRLRVVNPANGKTLAQFPMPEPEEDGEEEVLPSSETPAEGEVDWASDLTPLYGILNLNTDRMLMAVPPAANVPLLFVLDDYEGKTLYFKDMCEVTHWPRRRGEEEPTNLDDYKDLIEDFRERIDAAEESIRDAVDEANGIVAHVDAAKTNAQTSATAAGNSASSAQTSAATAKNWATGGGATGDPGATNNAKYFAQQAGASATNAGNSATSASGSATSAANSATAAEQWATGGTGGTPSATNNAKYYAEQAGEILDDKADKSDLDDLSDEVSSLSSDVSSLSSNKADKSTTYTKTEVDAIVAAVKTGSRQVVQTLPASGQPLVIYMVAKSSAQTNNAYDEYIWTAAGAWEKIGDTEIDLSGYVQKETGKGLSTNDYTTAEKTKLSGVESGAKDNVFEAASASAFPQQGVTGKIYVAKDENKTYRWNGSQYVQIGGGGGSSVDIVSPSTDPADAGKAADAKATGDALAGKASTADASLTPVYSQTPTYMWTCSPAEYLDNPIEFWIEYTQGMYLAHVKAGSYAGAIEVSGDTVTSVFFVGGGVDWTGGVDVTATRTRTDIIGYTLGSQTAKPLAALDDRNFAPIYSASATYAVGELCVHGGVLYRCTSAISTAEAWNAAHWAATDVKSELAGAVDASVAEVTAVTPAEYGDWTWPDEITVNGVVYHYAADFASVSSLPPSSDRYYYVDGFSYTPGLSSWEGRVWAVHYWYDGEPPQWMDTSIADILAPGDGQETELVVSVNDASFVVRKEVITPEQNKHGLARLVDVAGKVDKGVSGHSTATSVGGAEATSAQATAVGHKAKARSVQGLAVGEYTEATLAESAVSVGSKTIATAHPESWDEVKKKYGDSAPVAGGYRAVARGNRALAIGAGVSVTSGGDYPGDPNWSATMADGDGALALGKEAKALADGAIQIGQGTNREANTVNLLGVKVLDAAGRVPYDVMPTDVSAMELDIRLAKVYHDSETGKWYELGMAGGVLVPTEIDVLDSVYDPVWRKVIEGRDVTAFAVNVSKDLFSDGPTYSVYAKIAKDSKGPRVIEWGDGTYDVVTAQTFTTISHTYPRYGYYLIQGTKVDFSDSVGIANKYMTAIVKAYKLSSAQDSAFRMFHNSSIKSLEGFSWGGCEEAGNCFYECRQLTGKVPTFAGSKVTTASFVFGRTALQELGGDFSWGNVTNATYAFRDCKSLTTISADLTDGVLMPNTVTTHANCVNGASDALKAKFTSDWGGTKQTS